MNPDDIPCKFKLTKSKAYLELLYNSTEDKKWLIGILYV